MTVLLVREIDDIKRGILHLAAVVEERVGKAIKAIEDRDRDLAEEVVRLDEEVDAEEVELEEECLKILALHQPVASDLRFVVAVMKIDNDLERIGDLAVNIARSAMILADCPAHEAGLELPAMATRVREMLRTSLDAFVNLDSERAGQVCAEDVTVDRIHREFTDRLERMLASEAGAERVSGLLSMLRVSRELERIGDHATNIAEDLIYMVDGTIVRHHVAEHVAGPAE